MATYTSNGTYSGESVFREAEQYSQFIITNLEDGLLPDSFTRDVSDFGTGDTLNIKTLGSVTLQDVTENVPMTFNPISTGTVTLTVSDYPGDAWYITDEMRRDGAQVEALSAGRAQASTRALQEYFETKFLATCPAAQTAGNVSLVNGRPHRWVAGGASGTSRNMTMADFIAMKLAFDKAGAPQNGRIAIVDPVVEATINGLTAVASIANNPMFEGVITEGFAQNHKFVKNIFGWDIYTSNYLPSVTTVETLDASSYDLANDDTVAGDKANVFMCITDDNTRPIMRAWRQMPKAEGWRDPEHRRDAFQVSSKLGFGAQRVDTLGIIFTDENTY